MKYFLSLGSNIEPKKNLDLAILLKDILTETECSSVYTTQAEGFDGILKPFFCEYLQFSLTISIKVKNIEDNSGRDRTHQNFHLGRLI